ncbi:hypothetical protein E4K72_13275 [Oxalobacteraceae bacterium OM1]|nr:hypothetical protein E4K72_13275 [Oxalobacteraceae bacterium OM1]
MRTLIALLLANLALPIAQAVDVPQPAPLGKSANKAYRQVMPDGSIVYSDKPVKGAKIDETIEVEPPLHGTQVEVDTRKKPAAKPQSRPVPVQRVGAIPPPDRKRTSDEAQSEVVRAEMQLEDARKRQQAGVEPVAGERTGNANGTSRLNDTYWKRQQDLAQDVEEAHDALRKAQAERNTLLPSR